ncbi:MAG: metallophosphoesterase [Bacilli bacterium]|nr:metallophosphoesterase [Bacilli bacterium]MBQ3307631.1 metallophosphoesterase [Bacilli bacterium]
MNEKLIANWNAKVKPEDIVYHLGDFAFRGANMNLDRIIEFYNRLNGKKILIIGNHDLDWIDKVADKLEYKPVDYLEIKDGNDIVVLCHYPIEDWDGKHHGTMHVHGHIHGRDIISHLPNRFNAGVDVRNYEPVTLEEMKKGASMF